MVRRLKIPVWFWLIMSGVIVYWTTAALVLLAVIHLETGVMIMTLAAAHLDVLHHMHEALARDKRNPPK